MTKADQIYRFVASKIQSLHEPGSRQTASLAKLRRGAGKPPGASPEVWGLTLAELPSELVGYRGLPSEAEWAIHLCLTLFAIHQQGKSEFVNTQNVSFGQAASQLISPDRGNEAGIKSRFDAVLTARGINEFAHHTRGLIQLMKAKDVKMDYPRFARDIYDFQFADSQDRVRLRWGEDYYHVNNSADSESKGV